MKTIKAGQIVNGKRVKAVNADGSYVVNCSTCKGKGSYASSMVRGWRSKCVSCGGEGTRTVTPTVPVQP